MPKFTDLPIATTSKDNDIVCIVDPDANVSKQMTIAILKNELLEQNFLGGSVAAVALPVDGGAVQILNTYSKSIGTGLDPVTGEMEIGESGEYSFRCSILGKSDFSAGNTDGQWNNRLILRQDDGVGGIVDTVIGTFSSWTQDELVEWSISTVFEATLIGSPTAKISFGVQVSTGQNSDTYIIDNTNFFVEKI